MLGKGAPRCPRCNDNVYPAESVEAAGRSWHSSCYTCKSCKKQLGHTTQAEKDGELYCQNCYARNFGPKGYGIGGSTTVTGVSVSDSSSTCSSCGAGSQSGKFCSSCGATRGSSNNSNNNNSSNSNNSNSISNSSNIKPVSSSNVSYSSNIKPVTKSTFGSGGTTKILGSSGSDKCPRCGETAFFAESVTGAGRKWHQSCFTCESCSKGLDSTTLADKDGRLFCKACYAKNFGPKGYGFGGGGATTMAYTK